jgi:hypothetical protein
MFSLDHYDFGTPASEATEPVTLEIDGRLVTAPAGTSVMRAAAIAGTQIPKLCATDTLKAFVCAWWKSQVAKAIQHPAPRRSRRG